MHKGLHYPYHADLWAVSSQFYDVPSRGGWIPRKLWLTFAAGQPGPWAALSGYAAASNIGNVLADREHVTYEFPPVLPFDQITVQIAVAFPFGVKSTTYEFAGSIVGVTVLGAFDNNHPAPVYAIFCNSFVNGVSAPPLPGYTPPGAFVIRPALWAEV